MQNAGARRKVPDARSSDRDRQAIPFALQLEVPKRRPPGQNRLGPVAFEGRAQNLFEGRAILFRHRGEVEGDLTAKTAHPQQARQVPGERDIGLEPGGKRRVAARVYVYGDEGAGRFDERIGAAGQGLTGSFLAGTLTFTATAEFKEYRTA